jgi:hypothetical protein
VTATPSAVIIALLTLSTFHSSRLAGQDRPRMWLGAGLGSGARADGGGVAVMGELVYQVRPHHFALRGILVADPLGEDADAFGELGLLYGRTALRKWGHASIAAGLAITGTTPCSGRCSTLGLPVVAEISARLGSVVGVGLQGFANLNSLGSYFGFALFLQLGWMP